MAHKYLAKNTTYQIFGKVACYKVPFQNFPREFINYRIKVKTGFSAKTFSPIVCPACKGSQLRS